MASAGGGLTRRRGGARVAAGDDHDDTSRVSSPSLRNGSIPDTVFSGEENGHKIAYDPRDISESAERSKQPKLTLMEEIVLLGLKDKQVRKEMGAVCCEIWLMEGFVLARATCRSGMKISHMHSAAAS